MSYSVLVATPTIGFGDLIQRTLEDLGQFDVKLAFTTADALVYAGVVQCGAAILDGDLGEVEFRILVQHLSMRCQDIRLVIFPPNNDMQHPLLRGLSNPIVMRKPFYLPDLIEVMNGLLEGDAAETAAQEMAWVDVPRFEQLLGQTTARVAIICEQEGGAVFAGHLSEGVSGELATLAKRFWQRDERSDLVRFDRIEAGQLDCLLFLTPINPSGDTILGVVFPVTTPLSKVRSQAVPLLQDLRERKASAPPRVAKAPPPILPPVVPATQIPDEPLDEIVFSVPPVSEWPESALGALFAQEPTLAPQPKPEPVLPPQPELVLQPKPELVLQPKPEPVLPPDFVAAAVQVAQPSRPPESGPAITPGTAYPEEPTPEFQSQAVFLDDPAPIPPLPPFFWNSPASPPFVFSDEPAPVEGDTKPVKITHTAHFDPEDDWAAEEALLKSFNLAEMLGSIPSPDPNRGGDKIFAAPPGNGWRPEVMFPEKTSLPASLPASQNVRLGDDDEEDAQTDPDEDSPADREAARLRWEREVVEAARATAEASAGAPNQPAPIPTPTNGTVKPIPEAPKVVTPPAGKPANGMGKPVATEPKSHSPYQGEVLPSSAMIGVSGAQPKAENDGDNRDNVLTSLTSLDQLEPVAVGLSLLNYTCVLIPRLPGHFLAGELSEKLAQWIQQLCLAFGWRLEGISLRPEYLQWTVQVTPSISPGNVVKIIRQRTSDYIFTHFEALHRENPSDDFWANGYLIVSGAQPPSVSLLREYIAQTRRRQGVGRIPGDNAPRLIS